MELFSTASHFILVNGNKGLCINRRTSEFSSKSGVRECLDGAFCLGIVHGFIGKIQFAQNSEPRLIFIRERSLVGKLKGCDIYKIKAVIAIPLEGDGDILLEPCSSHTKREENVANSSTTGNAAGGHLTKTRPVTLTTHASEHLPPSPKKQERENKVERRMLDEFYKMFTEADSFYYAVDYDLTNSVQRQALSSEKTTGKDKLPIWYEVDARFFWNQFMLTELIQSPEPIDPCWIIPIIQGFIECKHCDMDHLLDPVGPALINIHGSVDLWLISRRSRLRAGTRYLKRGIDDNGNVANYVETEQIMVFKKHLISFVLIRGSIPLYWSQPGVRYRPPPRLERSSDENYTAFRLHVEEQGSIYGPILLVNLLDKSGKEKVLGDAFMENVLRHNSPELSYYTFDFHDNCRGMHLENVQILVDKLDEMLKSMNYCWIDSYGIVQTQTGVCRVNCMDCLDRTNVVQSFIARQVLCSQMCKLGLVSPEFGLPNDLRKCLQYLWANNGDTISKQYAGTSALKGDYTRTGERRFAGALKDGMNSANRYYLNRFKDAARQAVIDITLGTKKYVSEDELDNEKSIEDRENTAEQLKAVIEDTQKCVVPKFDVVLGSWGLVNARENDVTVVDVDTILILTETAYYVTTYDCMLDSIASTEKVKLSAIASIELGHELTSQSPGILGMFSSGAQGKGANQIPCLRITYVTSGVRHYHQFRSSNMRFFNNVCVPIHQHEEMLQALSMIADTIQIGASTQGNHVIVKHTGRFSGSVSSKIEPKLESSGGSWTQRYLNFNQGEGGGGNQNTSNKMRLERSFEKFTPKYFRSSAQADAARREGIPPETGVNVMDVKVQKVLDEELPIQQCINLDLILPKVVVTHGFSQSSKSTSDLVLASCGILAVPNLTLQRPLYTFSPSFLSPGSNGHSKAISKCGADFKGPEVFVSRIQKHRYSLPTSAALLTALGSSLSRSPLTPEITITEERHFESLNSAHLPLRISKSSVDVTYMGQDGSILSGSHLRPISAETGRSTSDQDISSSLTNSLKGSHSESSIKGAAAGSDPSQRFANARENLQLKKDAVLAPLGKLAGYFHPKKIKDSFKLQKREAEAGSAKDLEKVRILEERKQLCKSRIVDL